MGARAQTTRSRAIALAALLAGDYDLEGLSGMAPTLAEGARAAAGDTLEGPSGELSRRIAKEMASLLTTAPREMLVSYWGRLAHREASPQMFSMPGLRRLVQAILIPEGPLPSGDVSPFPDGGELGSKLVELSQALLAKAARGDRWAVHLMTRAAELSTSTSVSARQVPALVWLCAAFAEDEARLDVLVASSSTEVRKALRDIRDVMARQRWKIASFVATLRDELESELSRRG